MNPYIGLDYISTLIVEGKMLEEIIEYLEKKNKVHNKVLLLDKIKNKKFPILILNVDNPIQENIISEELKQLRRIEIKKDIKIVIGEIKVIYKIYIESENIYLLNESSTEEKEHEVIENFINYIKEQNNKLGIILKNNLDEVDDKEVNLEETINCLKFTECKSAPRTEVTMLHASDSSVS